ncbi:uncharacterized protein [Euphorbia lathyris]|uniref:uncharacterized protein n=1 Tax=Euphorbia lathyris TaxID=212925 RepID=UPI00331405FB
MSEKAYTRSFKSLQNSLGVKTKLDIRELAVHFRCVRLIPFVKNGVSLLVIMNLVTLSNGKSQYVTETPSLHFCFSVGEESRSLLLSILIAQNLTSQICILEMVKKREEEANGNAESYGNDHLGVLMVQLNYFDTTSSSTIFDDANAVVQEGAQWKLTCSQQINLGGFL